MGDRPPSSIGRVRQNAVARQQPQEQLFDTHPEVSLDFELVRQAASQKYTRPFLIIDTAIVRGKARRFRAAMPRVRPHYAVKANPDRRVLKALIQEGCGFEIASTAELDLLLGLGVPAAEIFFSNPVKSRDSITYAAAKGVEWFVIDSLDELRRVHEVKPTAKQYLRIAAPNIGSDWPLSGKFGAGATDAREIVNAAAKMGADLAGVTFHVGSQCRNPENWRVALEKARNLFDYMAKAGLKPRLLNVGGGFPVRHVKPIPSIELIGTVINEGLKAFPDDVQVIAEPGRYLVSDAGYFVCRVLGTATRAGKRWMHWDAGLFGGVIEASEGLKYKIRTDRSGPDVPWTVGGPTCDSVDIVMREEPLPSDLQEGDFIYIRNAGAYTTAYASQFNGFPLPEVRVFESKQ
ncbi:MAG: type III PLP-dependent enzyme [Betaproteobacteria bacterium]|nr:type III PLP-dependent enzyme [Betaproteobacteria bacterium]MBV9360012.1 type III PLP-dependent enzyme [Betaproteobacteria bacterium]